jgi:hypothetical protein
MLARVLLMLSIVASAATVGGLLGTYAADIGQPVELGVFVGVFLGGLCGAILAGYHPRRHRQQPE